MNEEKVRQAVAAIRGRFAELVSLTARLEVSVGQLESENVRLRAELARTKEALRIQDDRVRRLMEVAGAGGAR